MKQIQIIWFIFCLHVPFIVSVTEDCNAIVPSSYVRAIPPSRMTDVEFQYKIIHFDDVDVQEHSLTMRMTIVLTWVDERMKLSPVFNGNESIVTTNLNTVGSCLWFPSFFTLELQSMESFSGGLLKPIVYFTKNGTVFTYTDYKIILSCSMDLELYPIDIQACNLTFVTFAVSGVNLSFTPEKYNLAFRNELYEDLTYDPVHFRMFVEHNKGKTGVLSKLVLQFVFKRRLHLYVMATYFPSFLATIVSFTTFWIHPDAVPGRVTLGVTSLLALMTQMVSVRSAISNTNYVTSIDIWFLACISFVALSMFEFALSYSLSRNVKIHYRRVNIKNPSKLLKLKWKLSKITADQYSRILFPVVFFTFVASHFVILITLANHRQNMIV